MEPNEKPEASTDLAVQLISSSDKGNYFLVYDLKDGKVVKKFNLEKKVTVLKNWPSIFELLEVECPPNLVKSLLINVYDIPEEVASFPVWFGCLRKFGDLFGYEPVISTTFDITTYTTELLLAKKEGRSYEIGDHVIFARYLAMPYVDLCLMKKQEFGWDVLDTGFVKVDNLSNFKEFLIKNSIKADQLNKIPANPNAEYLELYGEYILRIYAGEEYANDYDCFVGNVCFGKYELVCGNSTIVLPIQFKRLPFTVKKKLKITNCKEIK
uniref:Uncharacterized protein n=1 Tax=Panagrolaimus sp. JU765 TaxID=591449 RepID=A0AC34RBZ3_9BILA